MLRIFDVLFPVQISYLCIAVMSLFHFGEHTFMTNCRNKMKLTFEKYHGAGNDFIILDQTLEPKDLSVESIKMLCDRHFGIGADRLIVLNACADADFEMKYYNADGYEGSMCGNGGRCAAQFAFEHGVAAQKMQFKAFDGLHKAEAAVHPEKDVLLEMGDVETTAHCENYFFINSGSPHYITFVKDLDKFDVEKEGRKIRHSFMKEGTNVNFVEKLEGNYYIRTFERGVEAETLACGTGITATAIAIAETSGLKKGWIPIRAKGGALSVYLEQKNQIYTNIWLQGPVKKVFEGIINY